MGLRANGFREYPAQGLYGTLLLRQYWGPRKKMGKFVYPIWHKRMLDRYVSPTPKRIGRDPR